MNLLLFSFLFIISIAADCPTKPDGYVDLPSESTSPQSGLKYYSCSKEYDLLKRFDLTNSLLTIYYCTFTRTMAYDYTDFTNKGVIHVIINNNLDSSLTGVIDIQFNTFFSCIGCALLLESSETTINFNIFNCTFNSCQSNSGASVIDFKAVNGNIEKCYFLNVLTASQTSGCINIEQPTVSSTDFLLTVTGNTFEHRIDKNGYSLLVISNNNCKFDFNNNRVVFNEDQENIYTISYPDTVTNFDGWSLSSNCIEPFNTNLITNSNNEKIINSFSAECKKEIVPCPPEPFPGSDKYINHCHLDHSEGVLSLVIGDKLIALFYCTFTSMSTDENNKGGAIYISVSDTFEMEKELPFKIYNCSFERCTSIEGGAIYIISTESSRLYEIIDCKFVSNKCSNGLLDDSIYGGAICIRSKLSYFEISRCTFESNEAGDGGAVYYNTASVDSSTKKISEEVNDEKYALKIFDCKFTSNTGVANGAAIFMFITNGEPSNPIEISNCDFNKNKATENEWGDLEEELPENGGAIYFEFDSSTANEANFAFHVFDCKFYENTASAKGGAICISITNTEPLKSIEIKRCDFTRNIAQSHTEILGFGSDICYTFDPSQSSSYVSSSKRLLESSPALQIQDCNFSNSATNHRGGSLYFSVSNTQTTRSLEIIGCSFKGISSQLGGAVDIQSTNPNVMFHLSDCTFQDESSIYFNAITGHVEKCRFNNIKDNIPIHYECNISEATNEDQSFTIDSCNFTQKTVLNSLIFFVPKVSSRFVFTHNEIEIPNNKTFVFDCSSDAQLAGTWSFVENKLNPDNELLINSENAIQVQLKASCRNGFLCTPQSTEPEPGFECEKDKYCFVNGDEQGSISYIDISGSNFNGLKDEQNIGGGAIRLINYGVVCNHTKFTGCKADNACGGGIYIHITKKINNPISFYDVTFKECSAIYGGAVYIYSSEDNYISFILCQFIENVAKTKSESAGGNLYGGSAIFMQSQMSDIIQCTFKKNVGSGVKIVNVFENQNSLKILSEFESSISIKDCVFEMDAKSTSSIFYVRGEMNEIQVDVKDCVFKGKLSKVAYHIDGVSVAKKDELSKLRVESCKFSSDKKRAVNSHSILCKFDESSQKFNYDETKKTKISSKPNLMLVSGILVSALALMVIISMAVIKVKKQSSQDEQNNENSLEITLV